MMQVVLLLALGNHQVSGLMKLYVCKTIYRTQDGMIIADVAYSKRHQQLYEILIFFTGTIQEISKVVCKKTR